MEEQEVEEQVEVPDAIAAIAEIPTDENVQVKVEGTEEEEQDRPHLEPKGTLSFAESQVGYEEMVSPFENVQQLNHCWLRGKEGDTAEPYDDIATICLEMNYQ